MGHAILAVLIHHCTGKLNVDSALLATTTNLKLVASGAMGAFEGVRFRSARRHCNHCSGLPSNPATLGTSQSVLTREGWPHFSGVNLH